MTDDRHYVVFRDAILRIEGLAIKYDFFFVVIFNCLLKIRSAQFDFISTLNISYSFCSNLFCGLFAPHLEKKNSLRILMAFFDMFCLDFVNFCSIDIIH